MFLRWLFGCVLSQDWKIRPSRFPITCVKMSRKDESVKLVIPSAHCNHTNEIKKVSMKQFFKAELWSILKHATCVGCQKAISNPDRKTVMTDKVVALDISKAFGRV